MSTEKQQNSKKTATFLYAEDHRLGAVAYDEDEDRWHLAGLSVRELVARCSKSDVRALAESPKGLALARCTARYMSAPQNKDAVTDLLTGRIGRDTPAVYAIEHALLDCHLGRPNANGFAVRETDADATLALYYKGEKLCGLCERERGYRTDASMEAVAESLLGCQGLLKEVFNWVRSFEMEVRDEDTVYDLVEQYLRTILDDLAELGCDYHVCEGFTVREA